MSGIRLMVVGVAMLLAGACGPLNQAMFERLGPEEQAKVNTAWNNMLSPPERLDRELLMGVIAEYRLYEAGITRGTFHVEKAIATGTAVMDITYDEQIPANDRFEIRIYDLAWALRRSETFNRQQIEGVERELYDMFNYIQEPTTQAAEATTMTAAELANWKQRHEEALKLKQRLDAATQPAVAGKEP